jgi:hypothetical protein
MRKRIILLGVVATIGAMVIPITGVAQQGQINNMFVDELQQNINIGAIVRQTKQKNKAETFIIVSREYFIERLKDTTIIAYQTHNLSPFKRDITKGYNLNMQINGVIDPVSAGVNVKMGKNIKQFLIADKIYEKNIGLGEIAYWELLDKLDLDYLNQINKAIQKGEKIYLVTRLIYIDSGYIEIVDNKYVTVEEQTKVSSINGNINFEKMNKDSLERTYKPNTAIAYRGKLISKKEIEQEICRRTTLGGGCISKFNLKSLVSGLAQFQRGDKYDIIKGHVFLWSEVVFIPASIVSWCKYSHYKEKSNEQSRNQGVYKNNRDWYLGVGIATTAMAAGVYLWNIIDGNINKNKNIAFIPYYSPKESGILFTLKF